MRKSPAFRCALWITSSLFVLTPAHTAETLAVVPDSAQALGMVGGRIANLNDASAVRVSPANILYAERPELLINASVWNGGIKFQSARGADLKTEGPWKYLGSMYAVLPVNLGRLAFGIGIASPYGLDSSYPRDGAFKYLLPFESRLLTLNITPAVAVRVSDSVRLGVGFDIMYSKLQLKQVFPWSLAAGGLPFPDGEVNFDGDGWGLGGYAGITWEIAKRHRLSVVGRLPVRVNYKGNFKTTGMPSALAGTGLQEQSTFNSDITFPGSISIGYGVDVSDRLTLGFDFMWSKNSSHDDVPLDIGVNQALLASSAVSLEWRDSIDIGTGLSYKLDDRWTLRAGYLWSQNSQGQTNYTPAVPSNDRHTMSAGIGWRGDRQSIDLAYAFVFFPDRHISEAAQPDFNGDYENHWHVLTLSYTHRF